MLYRWQPSHPDPSLVRRLSEELGLSPVLSTLLVNRRISEPENAWKFLNPSLSDLHDPFEMLGMNEVVNRLERALSSGEKILIYGDYDADGITSTVVLHRALAMLGGVVSYHIPHRLDDGYGLKEGIIARAAEEGIGLIVSVDCGIRDLEVCRCAMESGVDLIVTDHHLPDDELPVAYAILNPRQPGCNYPDKDLAAVGVVLKLVQALFEKKGRGSVIPHFLKVAAIGTVADMVPLRGENRTIVKLGLSGLSDPRNIGLQALLAGSGIGSRVDHVDVGFKLAPRINAFTRMGGGKEIIDLFTVKDPAKAAAIVQEMNRRNMERRVEEDRILAEVYREHREVPGFFDSSFVVLAGRDWHKGVIGNVAARVAQRVFRPVLAISLGEEGGQGSGRSIPGLHLLHALESCAEFFERFGGHAQAVGCTLKAEYCNPAGIEQLGRRMSEYVSSVLPPDRFVPELAIDLDLPVESVSSSLWKDLELLAPFGIGNPVPVFSSKGVSVDEGPWVLKEKHLKWVVRANGTPIDLIWWRNAEAAKDLTNGQRVDVAYAVSRDEYRGQERLLLTVKDLKH